MSEINKPGRVTATEVLATVGYDGFVRSLFNRSGDPSKDFAHAILGVVTEVYEMRDAKEPVNLLEEAGDAKFYGYAARQVVGDFLGYDSTSLHYGLDASLLAEESAKLQQGHTGTLQTYIDELINQLLDETKRWVGYGKMPTYLTQTLAKVFYVINASIVDCGCRAGEREIVRVNVEKLLERYNGVTFDAERAVNRNVDAERVVLEHAAAA